MFMDLQQIFLKFYPVLGTTLSSENVTISPSDFPWRGGRGAGTQTSVANL